MSDIYNSTGSMALPGEPETDFTVHQPIWEALRLPIGPGYSRGSRGLVETLQQQAAALAAGCDIDGGDSGSQGISDSGRGVGQSTNFIETAAGRGRTKEVEEVDWETFDFSATEAGLHSSGQEKDGATAAPNEIDDFFRGFAPPAGSGGGEQHQQGHQVHQQHGFLGVEGPGARPGSLPTASEVARGLPPSAAAAAAEDEDEEVQDEGSSAADDFDDLSSEENAIRRRELFQRTAVNGISCTSLVEPAFVLPEALRRRSPASEGLVGFETWSQYGPAQGFDCDDLVWDEDVYTLQAVRHLKEVTDLYLDDHRLAVRYEDAQKNASRVLSNAFEGAHHAREAVPVYLTPDAGRGIEYSDEVIEMKGKRILHPKMPDPAVAYVNDTFTHNAEAVAMNKIGTVRRQYDWLPRADLQHEIEPEKVALLRPVIDFINHAGELQSTKVCDARSNWIAP